ncbi:ABC transporter related protein [Streptomyces californicus]|uniref:ABC transporter related protein n=1 Tax=Streptomyces californicus TaxID=67351 RepID=UPI00378DCC7B
MYRPHHPDRRPPAERVTTQAAKTEWASLTESGKIGADGENPVRLDEVTRALAFLDRNGVLAVSR